MVEDMAPRKRTYEEVEESKDSSQRSIKHPKTDQVAQAALDSNSDSSYVSAAAAIFSDSEGGSDTAHSEVDSESDELSTSSEEPSSASESEEDESSHDNQVFESQTRDGRINVRTGSKPDIARKGTDNGLLQKLRSFIPEMREANERLDKEREDGTIEKRNIENYEEGRPHIEMVRTMHLLLGTSLTNCSFAQDLGLGVLEEKNDGDVWEDEENMSDEDGESQDDIMQRLMGEQRSVERGMKVQEIGDG
jgi:hypothetical protein